MDIGEFFGNVADQVKQEIGQAWEQGAPVLQASAEKWAINWLQEQNKKTQAVVDANVSKMANSPPAPAGSFQAALESVLGGSLIREKGPMVLLAVAGIGIVFYMLGKKGL